MVRQYGRVLDSNTKFEFKMGSEVRAEFSGSK